MNPRVAVIGAGWAGLAAAVRLAERGIAVDLFEAARTPGGRARSVLSRGVALDNGQHVLLGAYRRCLDLMRTVGVDPRACLRLPLRLESSRGLRFAANRWLPAPWHLASALITARGLSVPDRWALARFMRLLPRLGDAALDGLTVTAWTASLPPRVRDRVIEPICISALNTPVEEADARVFARVLRDSLAGAARDSDLLIPARDLGALLPEPALAWLAQRGAQLSLGRSVERLALREGSWHLDDDAAAYAAVVIAASPWRARDLLESVGDARLQPARDAIDALRYEPITTVYLHFTRRPRLPAPMTALAPDPARHEYGQFAFDRDALGGPPGWTAVVASAARALAGTDPIALVNGCVRQLEQVHGAPLTLVDSRVITEKRATWLCTPGLVRPPVHLPVDGLWLAGDYVDGPYPATLEQAVMSGEAAALGLAESGIQAPRHAR